MHGARPSEAVREGRLRPATAVEGFDEVLLGYESAAAQQEAQRAAGLSFRAATEACPFSVDIDSLVASMAAGDVDGAAEVVRRAHPWAGIMGRCCHRFCEAAMKGAYADGFEPVRLRALERAAADHGRHVPTSVDVPPSGLKVAVVGAGSGGIAAALGVLRAGHSVALFGGEPELGGMLETGYPNFRMPRQVLRRELPIQSPRFEFQPNTTMTREDMERVCDEFDAMCIATGQFLAADVPLPGEDAEGVHDALDLLRRVSLGERPALGREAVVLGAGYTAQDAARTARRLGAAVRVLYRRGPEEMPVSAHTRERFIRMMDEEGCPYEFFTAPLRIVAENGKVVGVECRRTQLGAPDASGRRSPVATSEPPFVVPASSVIKAFGQQPDFSFLPEGLRLDGRWVVNVDHCAARRGVFVVGDIAGDIGNDGAAAGGLQTAARINAYLADPARAWPEIDPELRMEARRPGMALEE